MENQGEGLVPFGDPHAMRVSDRDRQRVADLLRDSAGEGRLDVEELEERLEAAYSAKTQRDLVPLTADLPVARGSASPDWTPSASSVPAARHNLSVAVMSGVDRKGVWEIGQKHNAIAIMGGVVIDLREARFAAQETVITAVALMGGVDVIVNAHTNVLVEGMALMGGFDQARDEVAARIDAGSPVVRVRGAAIMGGVTVQRKPLHTQREIEG